MRTHTICLVLAIVLLLVSPGVASAQRVPKYDRVTSPPKLSSALEQVPQPLALKRPGHYVLADWRQLIDSAWGPGMSTAQKLQTFDAYWNKVDQIWGGFPNLVINWDSLRNFYRPLVAAGVNRGRFYGILSRLSVALKEWHVYAEDMGIDSAMGIHSMDASEYPNHPSFRYKPGIPLLLLAPFFRTHFGAGITSLGDSLALVYSVMPNHPLNLQPGDIILGFDGKPWKQLASELFEAEFPILQGGALGSTSEAASHCVAMSAGLNWGLYDTIDVLKYPSNDTLHYATSLLNSIAPPYFIATEQMPVKGVPFPNLQANSLVSSGVIEGTNIGYVYALDWYGVPDGNTRVQFGQAIDNLMHSYHVSGLILDFRTNFGGWEHYANEGFKYLFNFDPTDQYARAWRQPGNDHFLFHITPAWGPDHFTPTPELFDRPIAVLTGPNCGSAGDYNAFRMRFHPMVRFFGKPTAGAYTDLDLNPIFYSNGYRCRVDPACVYSNVDTEAYMIHKAFPVDERVWLTRDGVAKGEDDVVKRALAWMSQLTYAHDVALDRYYARPGMDSITVTAVLANPLHHTSEISAVLSDGAVLHDSVLFYNDGLHGDGAAGDSIWGARLLAPAVEGNFGISVETKDLSQGTSRRLPNAAVLTTAGPLVLDKVDFLDHRADGYCEVLPYVKNMGTTAPFFGGTIALSCADSGVSSVVPSSRTFPVIAAGGMDQSDNPFIIYYDPEKFHGPLTLHFSIGLNGHTCWDTTYMLTVTSVAKEKSIPLTYALEQNYPNPFNPVTWIKYTIGGDRGEGLGVRDVALIVYDVLGREVAILVNERKAPGIYDASFDAAGLSSGVYFYTLTAGSFTQTRKMLLIR